MQQSDQQDDKLFKKKNAKKRMVIQSQSQSQSQQSQMIKKRQILKELKKQEQKLRMEIEKNKILKQIEKAQRKKQRLLKLKKEKQKKEKKRAIDLTQQDQQDEIVLSKQQRQNLNCTVCLDHLDILQMPKLKSKDKLHQECLKSYIHNTINDISSIDDTGAIPNVNRQCKISKQQIQKYARAQDLQKYSKFLLKKNPLVSDKLDFGKTYLQCPGCDNVYDMSHFSKKELKELKCYRCNFCRKVYCLDCNNGIPVCHTGKSCKDYKLSNFKNNKLQQKNIRLNQQYLKKSHGMKCPNKKCGMGLVRDYGCDHIVCGACKTKICYKCGAMSSDQGRNFPCNSSCRKQTGSGSRRCLL